MKIFTTAAQIHEQCKLWRKAGRSIGFVPTMGYLHQGHLSLIKAAREQNDIVVVSIFVNPSQFGPNEDYARYPRDMAKDSALCESAHVDAIFAPEPEEMYPEDYITYVEPTELSTRLCGKSRPGHFRGVCTIVLQLFNLVLPDNAYFGQKDAQQFIILERMVRDLHLDLTMHCMPIIREYDGLAISSRNVYLSEEERSQALQLHKALEMAKRTYAFGERDPDVIRAAMIEELAKAELGKIDYLEIVDRQTLLPVQKITGEVLVAMAVYFGKTRLIDNAFVGQKGE